tara:strand:+ start:159 stop:746 length:588 start_codon:yes stop_codon:yes gene_type:complete
MTNELLELYEADGRTDKHTRHAYPWFYDPLLRHKKETAKNVLEIGVYRGGSLDAFAEFFPNAHVQGIDTVDPSHHLPDLTLPERHPRVTVHIGDGYDHEFLKRFEDIKWDVVLDDGPHTKESQLATLDYFHTRLAPNGILLIEDVREVNFEWIVDEFILRHPKHESTVYKNLSVINRKHTSDSGYQDEFIIGYME